MSPQVKTEQKQAHFQASYPTSPWTEAFDAQAAESRQQTAQPMPKRRFDSDAQAPTHDALSEVYNRGY